MDASRDEGQAKEVEAEGDFVASWFHNKCSSIFL
jgi:hypothetical protein